MLDLRTSQAISRRRVCAGAIVACFAACLGASSVAIAESPAASHEALRSRLEAHVQHCPNDPAAWRMLGKLRARAGDLPAAAEALSRATQLDPERAAAHYDLAGVLEQLGQLQAAADGYEKAHQLAPESDYGRQALERLNHLRPSAGSPIKQAGYEIKRFERSAFAERILEDDADPRAPGAEEPPSAWSLRLEGGLLYNTNVAFSPTNRELDPNPRESFQAFLNPDLTYSLLDACGWRAGPQFAGYFTANESDFEDLNLQSYQPGAFLEYALPWSGSILLPRAQYDYTLDRFGGAEFGQRHAMTLSVHYVDAWLDRLVYWTTDHTDFADDGQDPELSSRDGWTHTLGLSHTLHCAELDLGLGIEIQHAEVVGLDHRYNGIGLSADAGLLLTDGLKLLLDGGVGYRDYFDSDIDPSRNELLWHAAISLRWQITQHWSTSLVASYERFDSRNELFAADRFVGGLTSALEF